jgi:hypothetical protein
VKLFQETGPDMNIELKRNQIYMKFQFFILVLYKYNSKIKKSLKNNTLKIQTTIYFLIHLQKVSISMISRYAQCGV